MPTPFDITPTVTKYCAIPLERVRIIRRFEDFPLTQIRRGVVYLLAAWSGPSVRHFRAITESLSRIDSSGLEFYVVDIDCVPEDFMLASFQRSAPAGVGETLWVRDGAAVASVLTYSHSRDGFEAEFMRHTRELIDDNGVHPMTSLHLFESCPPLAVLRGADIWRDGGSYSATFSARDGSGVRFWLQVDHRVAFQFLSQDQPLPDPQARHLYLFAGWGFDPCEDKLPLTEMPILTGSVADQSIVSRIADFLRSPVVDVPFAHRTPAEHYIQRLQEMHVAIQDRSACGEEDVARFILRRSRREP